jgi:hypothetical protein
MDRFIENELEAGGFSSVKGVMSGINNPADMSICFAPMNGQGDQVRSFLTGLT